METGGFNVELSPIANGSLFALIYAKSNTNIYNNECRVARNIVTIERYSANATSRLACYITLNETFI